MNMVLLDSDQFGWKVVDGMYVYIRLLKQGEKVEETKNPSFLLSRLHQHKNLVISILEVHGQNKVQSLYNTLLGFNMVTLWLPNLFYQFYKGIIEKWPWKDPFVKIVPL